MKLRNLIRFLEDGDKTKNTQRSRLTRIEEGRRDEERKGDTSRRGRRSTGSSDGREALPLQSSWRRGSPLFPMRYAPRANGSCLWRARCGGTEAGEGGAATSAYRPEAGRSASTRNPSGKLSLEDPPGGLLRGQRRIDDREEVSDRGPLVVHRVFHLLRLWPSQDVRVIKPARPRWRRLCPCP